MMALQPNISSGSPSFMRFRFCFKMALVALLTIVLKGQTLAQVSVDPVFFTIDDSITITFDASVSKPSGALAGATKVYMHSGVITNKSTSPTDWKYVVGNWGKDDGIGKMTSAGGNKWRIKILPRSYYGVPTTETVTKLAMVFRSADGSKEGKDATTGGDIFVTLPSTGSGLGVKITSPSVLPVVKNLNDQVYIEATASQKCDMQLLVNDTLMQYVSGDSIINYTLTLNGYNRKWVKVIATSGNLTGRDSIYITAKPAAQYNTPPNGLMRGMNYLPGDTSVILYLFAPNKSNVYVIGDFNNWEINNDYFMWKSPDNYHWWVQINGLKPGKEYGFQYYIDGSIRVADFYADKVLDGWNDKYIDNTTYPNLMPYPADKTTEIVSVLQTGQTKYTFQHDTYSKPAKKDLVIYELLIRDFTSKHSFKGAIDSLFYLKNLGINCIHIMPPNEFEGNDSWGYNPSFYFAIDKYYGPKDHLKALIDSCHALNMAVIIDVVLNHSFGSSPYVRMYWDGANQQPASNSPYYNQVPTHPYNVGYDFNHELQTTKDLVDSVLSYWIKEYHVDGFRFDLTKGFTQKNTYPNDVGGWGAYDASRITILERMANKVYSYKSDAFLVFEHLSDNSEEKEMANNAGIMFWGRMNDQFNQCSMGYSNNADISWAYSGNRGFNDPNLVPYFESHDEERSVYKSLNYGNGVIGYNVKDTSIALDRMKATGAFLFCIPGPALIWEFAELGYPFSINRCPDGTIDNGCRLAAKPNAWMYLQDKRRMSIYNTWANLLYLKHTYPVFQTGYTGFDLGGLSKRISLSSNDLNVSLIGNFDVVTQSVNPGFQHTGWWYDYFSGDSTNVNNTSAGISLGAGQFKLYTDKKLNPPVNYSYQPKDTSGTTGTEFMSTHVKSLIWGYPNPANDQHTLEVVIAQSGPLAITVVDVQGRDITSLVNKAYVKDGMYRFTWDLTTSNGYRVAPGTYFIRVSTGSELMVDKVIVTPGQ